MEDQAHDNVNDLLRRFYDPREAQAVEDEIRAGERLLEVWSAPMPGRSVIVRIKADMAAASRRRRTIKRLLHSSLAAAAVVAFAVLAMLNRGPTDQAVAFQAAIIPAALWESDNIAADDLDLVYFTAEIGQIEAQLDTLEAGENEAARTRAVEQLEVELVQIDNEFWKGWQ